MLSRSRLCFGIFFHLFSVFWALSASSSLALQNTKSLSVLNESFEEGMKDWTGTGKVGNSYIFAAPHGDSYAEIKAGEYLQSSKHIAAIERNALYTVTLYVRSLNPLGLQSISTAKVTLSAEQANRNNQNNNLTISLEEIQVLNPSIPKGPAANEPNDDGGNVWFDGKYKLQGAEVIMYQNQNADPLSEEWLTSVEIPEPANYAPGPIHTPQGLRALYATAAGNGYPVSDQCAPVCDECEAENNCATVAVRNGCNCEATIIPVHLKGEAPYYSFEPDPRGPVLKHTAMKANNVYTSFFPSPGDAQLHYDDDTERLWMIWGGWTMYVTELDPTTGRMIGDPDNVEVDDCIHSVPSCATPALSLRRH